MLNRRRIFWGFLGYLLFVVYGSLIPFEYRAYSLDEALSQFADIPYLALGIASRADWIANIVLYIPLSFLACLWLGGAGRIKATHYLVLPVVLALVLAIATAVEFTQIFFAPRTVSINDLIAETLGGLGGIALWVFGRHWLLHLLQSFRQGGHQSIVAVFSAYGLFYLAQSLFPFDLVVSLDELRWKLSSDNYAVLLAGDGSSLFRELARLLGEVVAIVPLGVLAALAYPRWGQSDKGSLHRVFIIGAGLGGCLEFTQFFMASGVSQGLSVLMRAGGLTLGVLLGQGLKSWGIGFLARLIRQLTPLLCLPYVIALAALAGWFNEAWYSLSLFTASLAEVRVMPFYYHYYSTEPEAMASLLANMTMYMPVGLAIWAGRLQRAKRVSRSVGVFNARKGVVRVTAVAAVGLALFIELGKVLAPSKHPDFTNLLIAAVAAVLSYLFMRWLEGALLEKADVSSSSPILADIDYEGVVDPGVDSGVEPSVDISVAPISRDAVTARVAPHPGVSTRPLSTRHFLYALPLALCVGFGLSAYPILSPLLAFTLLAYATLLWRRPLLWLFVIPLLLPLLDLSQHTGRLLLDEFDLFVLVTLLVGSLRVMRQPPLNWPSPLLPPVLALLWCSWLVAVLSPLWPLLADESLRQAGSHSPLEAWMVGKGLLWALLLVPVIRRTRGDQLEQARGYLLWSLSMGLFLLSLVVIAERYAFVGLANFDNVFRVTGTFSSMRTGGAYIEAYIAFAFPALLVVTLNQRRGLLQALGVVVIVMAVYAMFVTYSRVGYVALALGFVMIFVVWLKAAYRLSKLKKMALFMGLGFVVVAVFIPLLSSGFAQYRLARSADDFTFRLNHWQQAIGLMDGGVLSKVLGEGFGQYPVNHLLYASENEVSSSYQLQQQQVATNYLLLRAGKTAYLEQRVDISPHQRYQLSLRIRQPEYIRVTAASPALSVFICEKALLYSFGCISQAVNTQGLTKDWREEVIVIDSADKGAALWPQRPVKLSLHIASGGIEIADLRLTMADGSEVLNNGDFAQGLKHWLFVTDQDLAWHIHQQWVEVFFAQGVLGLILLALLFLVLARVLYRPLLRGDIQATAFFSAFFALFIVGLLGSTMDAGRSSMLFYLMAFCMVLLFGVKPLPLSREFVKRDRSQ
ncbi:MAG: VanZ family protein [Candidatus Reddybacter sp.]